MFLQRALRVSLALVFAGGFAILRPVAVSAARAESPQESAIGPDALVQCLATVLTCTTK
jgi:hypothetical protein